MCSPAGHSEFMAWFSSLQSWARIELSVQLLHMHHPIELRFLGSVLESLARKNSTQLKPMETTMNDPNLVLYQHDMLQPSSTFRANLTVAIALLKSNNSAAALRLFQHVLALGAALQMGVSQPILNECLLIVMMAKHHPAFGFQSKNVFKELESYFIDQILSPEREAAQLAQARETAACSSEYGTAAEVIESEPTLENVDSQVDTLTVVEDNILDLIEPTPTPPQLDDGKEDEEQEPPDICQPTASTSNAAPAAMTAGSFCNDDDMAWDDPSFCLRCNRRHEEEDNISRISSSVTSMKNVGTPPVYVANIDCSLDRFHGVCRLKLRVKWSNDVETEVLKSHTDLYDFHKKMLDIFPKAAGCSGIKRVIPYFPSCHRLDGESICEDDFPMFNKYIEEVMMLSPRMLGCTYVCEYFGLVVPSNEEKEGDESGDEGCCTLLSLSNDNRDAQSNSVVTNEHKLVEKVDLRVAAPSLKQSASLGDVTEKGLLRDDDEDSFRGGSVKSLVFHNSEIMNNDFIGRRDTATLSICTDSTQDDSSWYGDEGQNNDFDRSEMSTPSTTVSACDRRQALSQLPNYDLVRWRSTESDRASLGSDKAVTKSNSFLSRHFINGELYHILRIHRLLSYRASLSNVPIHKLLDMDPEQLEQETQIPYSTCQIICQALREGNYETGRSESLNGMRGLSRSKGSPRLKSKPPRSRHQNENKRNFSSPSLCIPSRDDVGFDGDKADKVDARFHNGASSAYKHDDEVFDEKNANLLDHRMPNPSEKKLDVALDVSVYGNEAELYERERNIKEMEIVRRDRIMQEEYNRQMHITSVTKDRDQRPSPRRNSFAAGDRYNGNVRDRRDYNTRQNCSRPLGFGQGRAKGGFTDPYRKGGAHQDNRGETSRTYVLKNGPYRDDKDIYVQPGDAGWLESEIEFPPMANEPGTPTSKLSSSPVASIAQEEKTEMNSAPASISESPPNPVEHTPLPEQDNKAAIVDDVQVPCSSEGVGVIASTCSPCVPIVPHVRPPPMPPLPHMPIWYQNPAPHYPPRTSFMDGGRGRGKRLRMRPPGSVGLLANSQYVYSMVPPPNMVPPLHMQHLLQQQQHGLIMHAINAPHASEHILPLPPGLLNSPPPLTPPVYQTNGQVMAPTEAQAPDLLETNCCNCGAQGHCASLCTMPNIDDISKDKFNLDVNTLECEAASTNKNHFF